jgi:TolB-like protein
MLEPMQAAESEAQAARRQMERVLASTGFSRNERLARFLRFVIEQHLEGKDGELKESVIAIEVFGRRSDHDPARDSIVRTEASRLRSRLSEYYAGEGKGDSLIIELPKGGYTPVFRQPEAVPATAASRPADIPSRRGTRPWLLVALAVLAVAVAVVSWRRLAHSDAPIPIAVLPLTNVSRDPANDYFADGLTDEIIRNLSIIEGLAVRSQTSSFAFKGKSRNVREAGAQLRADYILEGSVLRDGQQLRINTQLVRVRDDFPVWSGRFDREFTDVVAIQDEISRGIVNSLRLKLNGGRRRYETSPEAYDLYLHARSLEVQSGSLDAGYNQSIGPYQEAIAKDPSFAPAYAGLAAAYAFRSGTFGDRAGDLANMRTAAEKALQLDPLLDEAHDALGMASARDAHWGQSEKSFRRAIDLQANRSQSHDDFAMYLLLPLGRVDEALQQARVAEKTDPLSGEVQSFLAFILLSAGRYDEAAAHCEKASDRIECLGRARIAQGRFEEAIQILAAVPNPRYFGHALGRAGRREEAEKLAATVAKTPFQQVLIFAGLGDKDRTFEALDRMIAQGPVRIGRALALPELALIRGDARVSTLRKKVGLPE